MQFPMRRCPSCGHEQPARTVADDEVCACGSRACLLSSAERCITTNRRRTGTVHLGLDAPPRNRMVAVPTVKK